MTTHSRAIARPGLVCCLVFGALALMNSVGNDGVFVEYGGTLAVGVPLN